MRFPLFLIVVVAGAMALLCTEEAEARIVCSGGSCYEVPDSGYSGGFGSRIFRGRNYSSRGYGYSRPVSTYSGYAQSYGSSGGYGASYGSSGGYGAVSYAQPQITYVVSSEPSLYSSTSTDRSKTTSKPTTDADGNVICNCEGCNCGKHVKELQERVELLEAKQPFYLPETTVAPKQPAQVVKATQPAEPKEPNWKKLLAEKGKPLPYNHKTSIALK